MDENTRCWTKIHDFAARFLFENRRFWTKIRDFAAVTGYAPRAARGAQWRVLSGSKTRHIIHLRGEVKGDKVQCTACACVMKNAFFTASLWHWNRHVQRKHTNHVQPEQEKDCGENQTSPSADHGAASEQRDVRQLADKSRVLLGAPPERVERSPKYFIFQRYSRRCRLFCSNKMCRWLLRVLKANGLQPGSQSRVQLCLHRFAPRRLQTTALQSSLYSN